MTRAAPSFDGEVRVLPSLTFRPLLDHGRPAFDIFGSNEGAAPRRFAAPLVLGCRRILQFLVPGRDGRWQALPVGIDRARAAWFDIFPEQPRPEEWEHWTQPGMTANSQCLPCHTTGYERGYRGDADAYATAWAEGGVACEACHGPGEAHVATEKRGPHPEAPLEGALVSGNETLGACVPCHSRRLEIANGFVPGAALHDYFDGPELLDTDIYYADGHVRGEAYEWWSFQMSRMAARGVTCLDCHEPHSGHTRSAGDGLCLRCHAASFAQPMHTHHPETSDGARCVACHMPVTTFMERDPRHDHAFQRPDPAGQVALHIPDACRRCHTTEPRSWAAEQARQWYGATAATLAQREVTLAIDGGRRGDNASVEPLLNLLSTTDPVRRTSIVRLLAGWTGRDEVWRRLVDVVRADPEPLVRAAAAQVLGDSAAAHPEVQTALLQAAADPQRLVRLEAAFGLRWVKPEGLSDPEQARLLRAFDAWMEAQGVGADLPESHYNRGIFLAARGDVVAAEAAYRGALARWARHAPAREALAVLLTEAGRPAEAERELRELVSAFPDQGRPHCLLGLHLGRFGRWPDGVAQLEACLAVDPAYPRAQYNVGLLYAKMGDLEAAKAAFRTAAADPAARADALRALVRVASEQRDTGEVDRWLEEALRAAPGVKDDEAVMRALGGSFH